MIQQILSLILVIVAFFASETSQAKIFQRSKDISMVPGELLVKTRTPDRGDSAKKITERAIQQTMGTREIRSIESLKMDESIQKVVVRRPEKVQAVLRTLRENPAILYAEPNYLYYTFALSGALPTSPPNDTDFGLQWDMHNTGQPDKLGKLGTAGADIQISSVWDRGITGSKKIIVAVIDTGVDYNHPELKENIYVNHAESGDLSKNGMDDDGNGVIDDVHGANFEAGVNGTNASLDDNDHGSHCAGTIGAKGNNGAGLTGVNWDVSILPVKFLSAEGSGSLEGAVNSIKYATKMKVNVMSNSWGGGAYSEALKEAIVEAEKSGILFVAAAGNDSSNNDDSPSYPASYEVPNVLAVAATNNQDTLATFSNYGFRSVQVSAPGVEVLSTVKGGRYDTFSGTSMACPHVAGMAALLLSHEANLTYSEVKKRLIDSSTPVRGLRRQVASRGRVNMANLIDGVIPSSDEPDAALWKDQEFSYESQHPYEANLNEVKEVSVPGARYIRVIFDQVDLENRYDTVKLLNSSGEVIETVSGLKENYVTDHALGDKITLNFSTDSSVMKWGFKISKIQVIF